MSFNLNKNEEPAGSSKKSSFDLSKTEPEAKKPKYWLLAVIALFVIGGIAWYLVKPGNIEKPAAEKVKAETVVPPADTAIVVPKPLADTAAAIVAASFKAGSFAPQGNIRNIISHIRQKQKAGATLKISVLGYASSEGDITFNQSISQARADAYKKWLIRKGIDESLVTAIGKGIENPIAPNDAEAGRRRNRRVEVSF